MTTSKQSNLYWTGGTFRVSISHPLDGSSDVANDAIAIIEEFRTMCQRQYIAFNGMLNGRQLAYERYRTLFDPANLDKTLWVGSGDPNENAQIPGSSVLAWINQGEFLEGLRTGGAFEQQHAKALVVFIYHLWDENYRKQLSQRLSIHLNQVQCTLMGDLRHIRNVIIHEDAVIPQDFSDKLELLPQIWSLEPGELRITEQMVHSLMEQINAIRIQIDANKPS